MSKLMTKTFAKYLRLGILPRPVRGNWEDGEYMYSVYHDDVQYTIDDEGDYENTSNVDYILECLHARRLIINRNHDIVREVHQKLSDSLKDDVWVRVGVGMQLHVVFGCKSGEIATLLMDFEDDEQFQALVAEIKEMVFKETNEIPEVHNSEYFALVLHERSDRKLLNGYFNKKVRIHYRDEFDEFGDEEDDDED